MKITLLEFKSYIKNEALKLYKKTILEQEKKEIENKISDIEENKVNPWAVCHSELGPEKNKKFERCVMNVKEKQKIKENEKPSAGLSKKEKSSIVKKAKAGKDIGHKGKSFKEVEKNAEKYGADNPKKVAAAVMWKNINKH